ncbi:hypothetical protein BDF20DRAFT_897710 [Mycotypha africana]|uniref:uncharacterized protein n=1 Tax=Mycotypha africana TaxID=64632 RepID=UPI002301CF86|nr:uncharacterized protein BDF20DRAFT_897710 [Mycotypha africana]KAI8967899.1 hypothetical protein BDF20DRAFT_897710 [Mycotypha africana]
MVRRGKKKLTTKSSDNINDEAKNQQVSASPQFHNEGLNSSNEKETLRSKTSAQRNSPDSALWTPIQLEQMKLSKQLDNYIESFKVKLAQLNFSPTNRELVILFIMNLHPRWRRLVEPLEVWCNEWLEAAAFARLHCERVSAILGCESIDSTMANNSDLFSSPESKALRDSHYFAFTDCPSNIQKDMSSVEHLLLKKETTAEPEEEKVRALSETSIPLHLKIAAKAFQKPMKPSISSCSSASNASNASQLTTVDNDNAKKNKAKETTQSKRKNNTNTSESSQAPTAKAATAIQKSNICLDQQSQSHNKPMHAASKIESSKQSDIQKGASNLNVDKANESSILTGTYLSEQDKTKVVHPLTAAAALAQKINLPVIERPEGDIIFSEIPGHHKSVNLAFLELTINQKKVRGLLAKLSWGSSAIALDCVKRLGLVMEYNDMFCLETDWGNVSSLGICMLPIHHPADPSISSTMQVQVLPSIYNDLSNF